MLNMDLAKRNSCAGRRRSPDQSEKSNGEDQGLLNKAWKVKTKTRQERSLKKRWEQRASVLQDKGEEVQGVNWQDG